MKAWVVGVSDCEGNSIRAICATKKIAERELFKARDELIAEWKKMSIWQQAQGIKDDMYEEMANNLLGNDYKKWNNYPQDCPYLYETTILEE